MLNGHKRSIVALAFCGVCVSGVFAQDSNQHPRIISVTGTAEIKLPPDEVQLTLGIDSDDRDLVVAKTDADQRVKKLLALAHAAEIEAKNIKTSALTMGPQYSDERTPRLLGYRVSETIVIVLTDISKYEELMTSFLRGGVNRVYGVDFIVADPKKYREEARLNAVRAAREKATTIAAALGQSLGKPWDVTEQTDDDTNAYLAGIAANGVNMRVQQDEQTIAGGDVTIRATVRVSFQLQ